MEPWTPEEEAGEIAGRHARRRLVRVARVAQVFVGLLLAGFGFAAAFAAPVLGIFLLAAGGTVAVLGGIGYAQS